MRYRTGCVERGVVGLTLALVLLPAAASAREKAAEPPLRFERYAPPASDVRLDSPRLNHVTTAVSTTFIATGYDFDTGPNCDMQGWTTVDATIEARYFHVASGVAPDGELNGGDYGDLVPLVGDQSLWCGLPPDTAAFPQCGFEGAPGYGNSWTQIWATKQCVDLTSDGAITYVFTVDSEAGYDATYVEASKCGEDTWVLLDGGNGVFDEKFVDSTRTTPIPWAWFDSAAIEIRFRFRSDGAFSDEDGFYIGDGALLLDDVVVTDASGTLVPLETFEDESPGDLETQDWRAGTGVVPFGDYAGLKYGLDVLQEDLCWQNLSCYWEFFDGAQTSTFDYACGGHPGQLAMPHGDASIGYMANEIWSPVLPWTGTGTAGNLEFDVYRDLPLDNLQFYVWRARWYEGPCPAPWRDRGELYNGDERAWVRDVHQYADLVTPYLVPTHVQFALGAVDMKGYWGPGAGPNPVGSGACHSHAPLLDNFVAYRLPFVGPAWSVREMDLFQDTFPRDGTLTGTGRADMAQDPYHGYQQAEYFPGDSVVVKCTDNVTGIFAVTGSPYFHRPVYCFVSVSPPDAAKAGANLENTNLIGGLPRFPFVGMVNAAGKEWTQLHCDRLRYQTNQVASTDRYCIDLPDDLFEAGDTIEYFFGAHNLDNEWSYWSREAGTVYAIAEAAAWPMEFQILPGKAAITGGDVLYVDGMDGLGAQPYFDIAFQQLGISDWVDRFDVNAPSSALSNRLGTHVYDIDQIAAPYRVIIWNRGDLHGIGDGISPDKCDDWFVLDAFLGEMETQELVGGLYLNGDDLPSDWASQTGASAIAMRDWLHYSVPFGGDDHAPLLGRSPYGVGVTTAGTAFGDPIDHPLGVDTLVAFGGCPLINDFDIVTAQGAAVVQMNYEGNGASAAAVVGEKTAAGAGTIGVMMSGFSFHYIRDDRVTAQLDRTHHFRDIMIWLGDSVFNPIVGVGDGPAYRNSLAQNYPNPFNPTTTIAFTVKEQGHVRLNVYNVAGALVRRLVDDTRAPGVTHTVVWDGRNGAGQQVASGVYFYKLVARDFTQTKKMVVLK